MDGRRSGRSCGASAGGRRDLCAAHASVHPVSLPASVLLRIRGCGACHWPGLLSTSTGLFPLLARRIRCHICVRSPGDRERGGWLADGRRIRRHLPRRWRMARHRASGFVVCAPHDVSRLPGPVRVVKSIVGGGWRALPLAGVTKQTAVIIAGPMILYALWTDWRRATGMAIAFAGVPRHRDMELEYRVRRVVSRVHLYMPSRIQALGEIPAGDLGAQHFWPPAHGGRHDGRVCRQPRVQTRPRRRLLRVVRPDVRGRGLGIRPPFRAYDKRVHPRAPCPVYRHGWAFADLTRRGVLPISTQAYASVLCGLQLWMLSYGVSAQVPTPGTTRSWLASFII